VASRHTSATTSDSEGAEVEPPWRRVPLGRRPRSKAEELRPETGIARVHNV
jgi:hypothetical protein